MDNNNICDYQSLLDEKKKLKQQIDVTGDKLKTKFSDLRNNYPESIIKPALPFSDTTNDQVFRWMEWANAIFFNKIFGSRQKGAKPEISKLAIRLIQVFLLRKIGSAFNKRSK